MKKNLLKPMIQLAIILIVSNAFGQKLSVKEIDLSVSKTAAKKGMYINTTLSKEGNIRTFISYDLKKGELGFDVFGVDPSGKLVESASELASVESQKKYDIEIPEPGTIENPAKGVSVLRLVTSMGVAGKLKLQEGYFEPRYATSTDYGPYITTYTQVLRGFKFVEGNTTKSDMRLNVFAAHCSEEDNLEKSYLILEGLVDNTVGYYNKNGRIAFIGWDASIPDKNAENGANVVITGLFDGSTKSFENVKENILSYNQRIVLSGYDGKGNRSVLVSTLNAPTSSAKMKQWQAKGKQLMTYMTMDMEGNVIDNVTFESKSVRGNFGIYGAKDADYVVGSVNGSHTGYYRFDVGSPSDFQIVKIQNGEVVAKEVFSMDQLESMLVTAGGKKGKLKYKDIQFVKYEEASNGDIMAFATAGKNYLVFHFDSSAKMKAVYMLESIEGVFFGVEILPADNDLYVLFRAQPYGMTQGLKKSYSKGAGYMKNTNFSRVDELMTYGKVVKINLSNRTCSEPVDYLEDVILGEDIMFSGSGGELIIPVRDKKRNYKMAVIN